MNGTPQRLVDATRQCLTDHGLAATTSRQIAGTAGANLGAITYYFDSKDELVATALVEGLREWLSPAIDILAADGDPTERTMAAIQTLIATFREHSADAPLYLEALLHAPRIEPLHRVLLDLWGDLRRLLAGQMAEMRGRGTLPPWVDPEAMASLLIAVANGLVLQVTVDPDGPSLDTMAAQFGTLLIASR